MFPDDVVLQELPQCIWKDWRWEVGTDKTMMPGSKYFLVAVRS